MNQDDCQVLFLSCITRAKSAERILCNVYMYKDKKLIFEGIKFEGKKLIFTVRLAKYVIDGFAASLMQSYVNGMKNANIFYEDFFFYYSTSDNVE